MDFSKMFFEHKNIESFTLVDATHILEIFIGLDDRGRRTLIVRNESKPELVKSTSAIDISIGQVRNKIWSIGFHLKDNSMSGLFYKFCDDLVESSRSLPDVNQGMQFITKRYNQWKKMFYKLKKDLLTESEIMGLIGELLFLKNDLSKKYGYTEALKSWSGVSNTHKDFSINDDWFEIKSTNISSLTVKISSIEQLDSDVDGTLIVYEFEKMSEAFDGLNINGLISEILTNLDTEEEDILFTKLKEVGYYYDDTYDNYVFRLVNMNRYIVNNEFPKIKSSEINSAIVRVKYEILKKDLVNFLIK